jgi:hypothetical protein
MLQAADQAATADAKGDLLEQLTRYIFERLRGVSFEGKNILDGVRAHELDVVFWNGESHSEVLFLAPTIIVECKHTAAPVGSAAVGWFVRKLQDSGASHGVLVALTGITGDDNTNAHHEVVTALIRDKIKILVITRPEIEALTSTKDLAGLLKRKLLTLTLKRTVA